MRDIGKKIGVVIGIIGAIILLLWYSLFYILRPNLPPGGWESLTAGWIIYQNADNTDNTNIADNTDDTILNINTEIVINNTNEHLPEVTKADLSLILGGDVMLSRDVYKKTSASEDFNEPWKNIADTFKAADLTLINLEAPFIENGPYAISPYGMVFKVDPKNISGLTAAGIDAVSLANNHIYNQGQTGVDYTESLLTQNNIAYSLEEPVMLNFGDYKLGFCAYSYTNGLDIEKLTTDIANLKTQGADFIVISMHAGNEYTVTPSSQQEKFAHAAIDAGANLVWGHHPHVTQPLEKYGNGYIAYSLGNLIFDQNWSTETTHGLVLKVNIKQVEKTLSIRNIELKPVVIEKNFQPRFMDEKEGQVILDRLGLTSYLYE